ncbi:MAG: hypothetical protein F6K47_43535 [Symploca sp. SIO2E6]|nr:hypothetical protein [Symploca sp. SIO2E6]
MLFVKGMGNWEWGIGNGELGDLLLAYSILRTMTTRYIVIHCLKVGTDSSVQALLQTPLSSPS